MIPFVIVACLTAEPAQCAHHVFADTTSLEQCQTQIEARVVLWSRDHRFEQVTKAYCLPPRPMQGR